MSLNLLDEAVLFQFPLPRFFQPERLRDRSVQLVDIEEVKTGFDLLQFFLKTGHVVLFSRVP